MPVRKKYILAWNKKAKKALLEMEATLTPGTMVGTTFNSYDDMDYVTYDILYVSDGIFDEMSSSQFGKFLRKNNLSIFKQ